MAAAINQRSKQSRNITKAIEVQSATHEEILSLGEDLFKKALERQEQQLKTQFADHEQKFLAQLKYEHKVEFELLEKKHKEQIEKLKLYYADVHNDALKNEAERVRDVMQHAASELVEEETLEGQRKLDTALRIARESFDVQKEKAIQATILEQQKLANEGLMLREKEHRKIIESMNIEWRLKLKEQSNENSRNTEEILKTMKEKLEKEFQQKQKHIIDKVDEQHANEVERLMNQMSRVENEKNTCDKEIKILEEKITNLNEEVEKIMTTFQHFVDSTRGFQKGQSDFIF